ncbi:MAG: TIGR03617 family F420-dependent LLM class oxidoreductase [Burkholderiales bacterium]|nr:TIGR03617 family F420-dependent LLM class oxidoreductase [Burkholderiales bacterium]
MRVSVQIPNHDLRLAQDFARRAERAGFDSLVALENQHNPYLPLAAAALVTERIQLGTAVALAFTRSPTTTAHIAWDLQNASNGRFYLGLGAQVKAHNEHRYGVSWTPPAPRMRDYAGAVRAVHRCWEQGGESLDYHSDTYNLTLMTPNFSPKPNGLPRIPVSMSAVGPAMLRVAGQVYDGVRLHPFSTRRYLEVVSNARIAAGLESAGRERRNMEIISGGFIATGPNETVLAKWREYVRFRIAFYCSTKAYWDVLRLHGMEDLGLKIQPYPRERRWKEMAALISDETVDLFAVVAKYDDLPAAIEKRYGGLTDTLYPLQLEADFDPEPLREVIAAIQKIPCAFEGYAKEAPVAPLRSKGAALQSEPHAAG